MPAHHRQTKCRCRVKLSAVVNTALVVTADPDDILRLAPAMRAVRIVTRPAR
jgi:hypothetical protein